MYGVLYEDGTAGENFFECLRREGVLEGLKEVARKRETVKDITRLVLFISRSEI